MAGNNDTVDKFYSAAISAGANISPWIDRVVSLRASGSHRNSRFRNSLRLSAVRKRLAVHRLPPPKICADKSRNEHCIKESTQEHEDSTHSSRMIRR
jgi:hypothetical protein